MKKIMLLSAIFLISTVGTVMACPRLMVLEYGADYHYQADEYFIGPWQYEGGDTVEILYESEDSSVANPNYFMGPYYGPWDLYDGDEGNFIPVDEDEDDGFYTGTQIDSVTVVVGFQCLPNVYLVATIYEPPSGGYLEVDGTPATWDSSFHEANGWDHEGAWSATFFLGDMPPFSQWNGHVMLTGYQRVEFWAFSDINGNGEFNNCEYFSPSSHNLTFLGGPTGVKEGVTKSDQPTELLILKSSSSMQLGNLKGVKKAEIFDLTGKRVLVSKPHGDKIPLGSLSSGYYFILLDEGVRLTTQKLLVLP